MKCSPHGVLIPEFYDMPGIAHHVKFYFEGQATFQ